MAPKGVKRKAEPALETLRGEVAALKNDLAEALDANQRLQNESQEREHHLQHALNRCNRGLTHHKRVAANNSARAEEAEKKVDSLSAGINDIDRVAKEILSTSLEGKEVRKGSDELGGVRGVVQCLHAVRELRGHDFKYQEGLQEQLGEISRELEKGKGDIVVLQQRVKVAEGQRGLAIKQVEELSARELALQQKLKDAESERDSALGATEGLRDTLRGTERELEKTRGEVAVLQQRVAEVEAQRGEVITHVEELLTREVGLQRQLQDVESNRDSALGATEGLRDNLRGAERELEKTRGEVAVLQQRVEEVEAQRGKAITHVEELLTLEVGLQRQLQDVESNRDSALGATEGLRADLERALEELEKSKVEFAALLKAAVEEVQQKLNIVESEKASALGATAGLKADLKRALEQHTAADKQVQELKLQLSTAVWEATVIRKRIGDNEAQLQDAREREKKMNAMVVTLQEGARVASRKLEATREAFAKENEARATVEKQLLAWRTVDVNLEKKDKEIADLGRRLQMTEEVYCTLVGRGEQVLEQLTQSRRH